MALMYADLFFLKYYRFSAIRSITAYNYLSVLNSLLHGRFSVVTQLSFHWKRLCSRLLFKRRENNFLLCRASLLRLLKAYFDARVDLSPS